MLELLFSPILHCSSFKNKLEKIRNLFKLKENSTQQKKQKKKLPSAGAAPLPNCHHLGPDNAGNCISRRAGADETCRGQILLAHWPLLLENFIFPQGSHEC